MRSPSHMRRSTGVSLALVAAAAASGEPRVHSECVAAGMIAFTFDQGPSAHTGVLLSALEATGAHATFHVVPDYLENPVVSANLRRAAANGHLIGVFVPKQHATPADEQGIIGLKNYLDSASKRISAYTGTRPLFLRFAAPGPSPAALKAATELGMHTTTYNLDSMDYAAAKGKKHAKKAQIALTTVRGILDQIVPPTLGSFIVVQRDTVAESVAQSGDIVKLALDKGYRAVRLDECIGLVDGGGKDRPHALKGTLKARLQAQPDDNTSSAHAAQYALWSALQISAVVALYLAV